jgi:hypothetical protein
MYDQEHIGKARLDPARQFKRPMDVVEAVGMTVGEKLEILEAWEADERALQRAEDEGMAAGSMPIFIGCKPHGPGSGRSKIGSRRCNRPTPTDTRDEHDLQLTTPRTIYVGSKRETGGRTGRRRRS